MVIEAKIKDKERFSDYATIVPSIVKNYGGEYIVLGGKQEKLEVDDCWDDDYIETRIVISRWPNVEAAKLFWESPEYAQVKMLREGTGSFKILLLEGLSGTDTNIL